MTVRLLADENIDPDLLKCLRRRVPDIDFVIVQGVGLQSRNDPTILQWAADANRVLVTHDFKTVPGFAFARVTAGRADAGSAVRGRYAPFPW